MNPWNLLPTAACGALVLAAPALGHACEGQPTGTRLNIVIDGVRSDQGQMTATLYPPENGKFLRSRGEIALWRVPAQAPTTEMCVWVPAPGAYAVAVYADLNGNRKFDHSAIAPLEPYGFSNNPRLFLGPPPASAAKFDVAEGETTIHIKLRYPPGVGPG